MWTTPAMIDTLYAIKMDTYAMRNNLYTMASCQPAGEKSQVGI